MICGWCSREQNYSVESWYVFTVLPFLSFFFLFLAARAVSGAMEMGMDLECGAFTPKKSFETATKDKTWKEQG